MLNKKEFLGLKKWDLVALDLSEPGFQGIVKGLLKDETDLRKDDLTICRVLKFVDPYPEPDKNSYTDFPASIDSQIVVELRSIVNLQEGFKDKKQLKKGVPEFNLTLKNLLRKAKPDDVINSVDPKQITKFDLKAIEQPAQFIAEECDYRWLPSHGDDKLPKISVRDRYMRWDKDKSDLEGISKDGGMRALLEYRSWITERILEIVKTQTSIYVRNARYKEAMGFSSDFDFHSEFIKEYVKATPLFWEAPGSTTPTSDIDVSLKGDGTEYAVQMFNMIFQSLHNDVESGIVFDVNVYGPGFVPEKVEQKRKGDTAELIRPMLDHEFANYQIELADADDQLKHALIKLCRYMADEKRWKSFCGRFGKDLKLSGTDTDTGKLLKDILEAASKTHLTWKQQIEQSYNNGVLFTNDIPSPSSKFAPMKNLEPAKLMAVQNRFYEYHLRNTVEKNRSAFNLAKAVQNIGSPDELDQIYRKLRDSISISSYFSNEAYSTAGPLIQTVGGKQMMSRGIGLNRESKTKI